MQIYGRKHFLHRAGLLGSLLTMALCVNSAEYGKHFGVPEPDDVLTFNNFPSLHFPGQNSSGLVSGNQAKLYDIAWKLEQLKAQRIVFQIGGGALSQIPSAGKPLSIVVNQLGTYLSSVNQLQNKRTELKIEMGVANEVVSNSFSRLSAQIGPLRNRLREMLDNSRSIEERKLSVIPAIHACEIISHLFADKTFLFWRYKVIFAPYLLTFAALYSTIAEVGSQLLPSQNTTLAEAITQITHTIVEYRPEVTKDRMKMLKIVNEEGWSQRVCPKIKIIGRLMNRYRYIPDPDWDHWDRKIKEWKDPNFDTTKTGCVLGNKNNVSTTPYIDGHRGAKVFEDKGSGNIYCGWANCWKSMNAIVRNQIDQLFDDTLNLLPKIANSGKTYENSNPANCRLDDYGRYEYSVVYWPHLRPGMGCHKGKCWAYCDIPFSWQRDWCYTGGPSEKITKCTTELDCCPEWKCGTACWAY